MGDESAVSGASEMSGAQSTAQGAEQGGQGKGLIIAVVAVLVIAAVVGVLVASGAFEGHESAETEESGKVTSSGGGPGGGPPAVLEPTTRIPVPRPKVLMCTTRYPGPGNDPPAGVCHMVVYDADKTDLTKTPPKEVGLFMDFCKKKEAICGLNIEWPTDVSTQLDTPETKTVMADLHAAEIKHYGLLRSQITPATKAGDLTEVIDVLTKLTTFMKTDKPTFRDILFWGVSTPLGGAATPPDSMLTAFTAVLKALPINMLVYQTSYVQNISAAGPKCVSTGTAMWKSAPIPEQPTFEDSLKFWKAVRADVPHETAEMLSFSLCGYWAAYGNKGAKAEFGLNKDCQSTNIDYIESYACVGAPKASDYEPAILDKDSVEYISLKKTKGWTVGYDMNDTIVKKICMATVNFGFDGGWAVHNLQCHFKEHCMGKDVGGFPRVKVTRDSMWQKFTTC